MEWKKLI